MEVNQYDKNFINRYYTRQTTNNNDLINLTIRVVSYIYSLYAA